MSYLQSAKNAEANAQQQKDAYVTEHAEAFYESNYEAQAYELEKKWKHDYFAVVDAISAMKNLEKKQEGVQETINYKEWDETNKKTISHSETIRAPHSGDDIYQTYLSLRQNVASWVNQMADYEATLQTYVNKDAQYTRELDAAKERVQTEQANVDAAAKKIAELQAEVDKAEAAQKTKEDALKTALEDEETAQKNYTDKAEEYNDQITTQQGEVTAAEKAVSDLEARRSSAQDDISSAKDRVSSSQSAVDEARQRAESIYAGISYANSEIDDALNQYYAAEEAYLDAEERQLALRADSSMNNDGYSFALQDYRTELQLQRSIDSALVELRARALSDGIAAQTQKELIAIQFENAKDAALAGIDNELKQQEEAMRNSQIRATRSGVLTGLRITEGSAVQSGATVANVKSVLETTGKFSSDVVVCYVPLANGRRIEEGMKVKVYPSTVNKNEYGHMTGVVTKVDNYVTSKDDMTMELGDSTLVDTFSKNGPVVAVTVALDKDPATASGYAWTNAKGNEITIDAGTVVTTDTIIENKIPISMLIPYISDLIGKDET